MKSTARNEFWDITKATLMWLVVLGHTIQVLIGQDCFSHPLFKAIYLFHLPVFFFISGYFAYTSIQKRAWKGLTRSAIRLLAPIVTFGTIEAIHVTYLHSFSWSAFLNCYVCFWFLWSLFECQVLGHLISLSRNPLWKFFCFLTPIILCAFFTKLIPYANYLSYSWPFFALGMLARFRNFSYRSINSYWLFSIIPAFIAFCFFRDDWYIYLSPLRFSLESIGIALFRFIAAITASTFFLALMHQCAAKLRIAKMGTATLGVYIVHSVLCFFAENVDYPPFCAHPCIILSVSVLLYTVSYFIYHITSKIPIANLMVYGVLPVNNANKTKDL